MWQNVKYYAVAYVVVVAGVLVATGFQLLEALFPDLHPLNKLAANLSGVSVGTMIMVVGLIRDKRVDDARKETNKQRQRADKAEAAIAKANRDAESSRRQAEQAHQQAEQAREQAEQERLRARKAEAELARIRAEYEAEVLARIRRLEEFTGMRAPEPDPE